LYCCGGRRGQLAHGSAGPRYYRDARRSVPTTGCGIIYPAAPRNARANSAAAPAAMPARY